MERSPCRSKSSGERQTNTERAEKFEDGRPITDRPSCSDTITIASLPCSLKISICQFLFVRSLLELRRVDRAFSISTRDEGLWKGINVQLWEMAANRRIDHSTIDPCIRSVYAGDATTRLTAEEASRCIPGLWPRGLNIGRMKTAWAKELHPLYHGQMVPSHGTGEKIIDDAEKKLVPGDYTEESPDKHCTGVYFSGEIGGNRCVVSDMPFPWTNSTSPPSHDDICSGQSTSRTTAGDPSCTLRYPESFLCSVPLMMPFVTLWPGQDLSKATERSRLTPEVPTNTSKDGSLTDFQSLSNDEHNNPLGNELAGIPSTGCTPFFHAGYTAYFEITLGEPIVPAGMNDPLTYCVSIGVSTDRFDLRRLQIGRDYDSWGYHSDDGRFFHGRRGDSSASDPFGPGDTVGCGLIYSPLYEQLYRNTPGKGRFYRQDRQDIDDPIPARYIFFTKNGRYLGIPGGGGPISRKDLLYPTVGLNSHCPVDFNFGSKPFAFDLPAFEAHIMRHEKIPHYGVNLKSMVQRVRGDKRPPLNPRCSFPYGVPDNHGTDDDKDDNGPAERFRAVMHASPRKLMLVRGLQIPS